MTALDALRSELLTTQRKIAQIAPEGIVPGFKKYEYKNLVEYAKKIKEGIDWFNETIQQRSVLK